MFEKELKDELQNNQDINNDIQKPLHERDYFKELCYCEPVTAAWQSSINTAELRHTRSLCHCEERSDVTISALLFLHKIT